MAERLFTIKSIRGIDNISDPATISYPSEQGIYVAELDNADVDNDGKLHRRLGYGSRILSGTNVRSLWANEHVCLFVDGTTFKKLNVDDTVTTLVTDLEPTEPLAYVAANHLVFFGSNSIVGYVDTRDGLPYPFPDPDKTFKTRMVGGHILEFYNNRLYAANGHVVYFSDPTVLTRMDTRRNSIAFPSRVTMMRAVKDGMYVSDSKNVHFLAGDSPLTFSFVTVLDVPAIEGMSITLDAADIGRGVLGRAIYFMTEDGPHKGYPSGNVLIQQGGRFSIENIEKGTALLRQNGYQQFLTVGQLKAGLGGAYGDVRLPSPTI